ncbi:hypothetical protein LAZ67_X004834 [Cordylochernes scorpioides]|uniref:Cyclic nucleotide-binding domain-containing protein n=1 Tax=Cordylochernes scorpioides TaxID=51811 RepID=A0ABY6LVA8_9ARAC|nr:hypothetical protein LAZ67_X004834 [Cordylochernes scorpioides]
MCVFFVTEAQKPQCSNCRLDKKDVPLVQCVTCAARYHPYCQVPPIPRSIWDSYVCTTECADAHQAKRKRVKAGVGKVLAEVVIDDDDDDDPDEKDEEEEEPGLYRLVGRSDVRLFWHRLAKLSTRPEATWHLHPSHMGHPPQLEPSKVHECLTTRQKQATFRARSAAGQADQCVYLEICPDFTQEQYFRALEVKLGKCTVYQLTKMEGQILVGLSTVQQADKLVEDGLEIEDALLRATPLKKPAERIVIGNVQLFVENGDLVTALRPYGQITSIVQKMMELGESYWPDARREAFITLRDGVKLSHIPARLEIKSKGATSHVYVTYDIKCSLCYKHGHKRANPRKTGVQEANLLLHLDPPAGPNNAGGRQPSSSNAMPAPVPTPAADSTSTPAPIPAASPAPPAAPTTPAASLAPETLPTASVDPVPPTSKPSRGGVRKTQKKSNVTRTQLNNLLERIPSNILDQSGLEGLERGEILEALASVPGLKSLKKQDRERAEDRPQQYRPGADRRPARLQMCSLKAPIGRSCPDEERPISFRLTSINVRGLAARERSIELCHFLRQHRVDVAFIQETNASSLDAIQHLCLGYSAVIVPPAALRGLGLACLFVPRVAVLRQRVLCPGNIFIVSIDVRGQEVRVINCHLSHIPRERLEQLESITAAAIHEDAWVVGDLNVDEQSTSDTTSGSVEALTELIDQTALVDVATVFNAEHFPTRVAYFGRRVDAARLDIFLLPSRLVERVTLYKTIYYRISDHRAVLIQIGSSPLPRQPCVAAMLRSALVDEHLQATIARTSEYIADMTREDLWRSWSKIKVKLLAEVRSLHVPRVADDDHIARARRFLQARLEAASHRFAHDPADPAEVDNFIAGTTTPIILEEDDPLHRPDISGDEIAVVIRTLPTGKAPGWGGLPCELLSAYEDFFSALLWRVFGASLVRGALPSSIRRGSICLVPKARSGPGLTGFRPITLPSTDYRVLAPILLRYPSWNIARVTDEVEIATAWKLPLAVVSVDLESAFDSLDRGFLLSLLVSLGLPPAFISLATTPLLRRLQSALGEGNVVVYADDIVLMVRRGEHFGEVASIFQGFQRASGIRVNFKKSVGIWCGAWRARVDSPLEISWTNTCLRMLGCDILPRASAAMQEGHLLDVLNAAFRRWAPFSRGFSLVGEARAANCLVLSSFMHHLHGYIPTDSSSPSCRPVWCSLSGVPIAPLGCRLASYQYPSPWVALAFLTSARRYAPTLGSVPGAWLTPLPPGTWLPARRRRLLGVWEAASEILDLNHRVLLRNQLLDLTIIGGCRLLRPLELLATSQWVGARVGDLIGHRSPHLRVTRAALADEAALSQITSRLLEKLPRFLPRLTTRTARRMLERPRLTALPIFHLLSRWQPQVDLPVTIAWRIRPVILEAFTIIQQPPDLQGWIFGHGLEDDALAILASAKARIYRHFLTLELRGVQEDPLLPREWAATHANLTKIGQVYAEESPIESEMPESHSYSKNDKNANTKPAVDGGHANYCRNWADCPEQEDQLIERQDVSFTKVGGSKKRPHDSDHAKSGTKKGCIQEPGIPSNSSRPRATPRPSKADQCVYLEFCPDFMQEKYSRALEAKMGKETIYELTKMEGHILVGLSSVQFANKLIEEGLNIEDATLC